MSYCKECGAEIPDNSKFCPKCGAPVGPAEAKADTDVNQESAENPEQNDAAENEKPSDEQPDVKIEKQADVQLDKQETSNEKPKMKWFKTLIYVALFVGAGLSAVAFVCFILGLQYGSYRTVIYQTYPRLQIVDIVFGIFCLSFAAMAIFVRQQLAHYKRFAPWLFIGYLLVLNPVVNIIYLGYSCYIVGDFELLGFYMSGVIFILITVAAIAAAVAILVLNVQYFIRRRKLFRN